MNRETTSKIIDEILRYGVLGAGITATLIAPKLMQSLDPQFNKLFRSLNAHERQREAQRVIRYMKQQGLLAGSYEHGLEITEKAQQRLSKADFDDLQVKPLRTWDKRWRIIIYDIPEQRKTARDALGSHLLRFGCFQLQKSTWITPFPCRDGVIAISAHYHVNQYVSYFEAVNLDNAAALLARFKRKYPSTRF